LKDQVLETATKLGYSLPKSEYYLSETKGLVKIKEMNTTHLRNAILKEYREWVQGLSSISNPRNLVNLMMNGLDDVTWLAMVKEYATRKEE